MSFITGTNIELIYANTATGTASSNSTLELLINDTAGMGPQAHLPPDFFPPVPSSVGKGIRIVARGIFSTTGTPTYQFRIRAGYTGLQQSNRHDSILLGSAALTTTSGASNQPFEITGDVFVTIIGATGENTTVRGLGQIQSPGFSTTTGPVWGNAASPGTIATFDTSIVNYINVSVQCSAASASNIVTLQQLLIFGLN